MSRKSAITTLEKRIEKLVQDNRKLQSELEQERHFAEGLSKANEVLARKYRAEKTRADAMAVQWKRSDTK
ncbi:hypothetical protein B7C51_20370 [Paenibacillus larvae subsp. pulvifaciens]|uniref:Uncharacterized protein n=1 Tax=Paenibacillus larvae subsp. pulvifaciens TaxID=1477 RepID=A0A1V0UPI9_9BACL|nr:hypothetical protein [Paenibacillus larvae]ARF67047.1 hypothetical protein B7C51_03325 [Paenibacillus larvae subsp. pulvifaciens]ARF69684.1 hypothetical protein B7C51_20370 [Paenibacillus larvae subsp. pulvifaciens]